MRLKIKKEVIGVEEWRVIEGYENYAISNYGNVKNIKTNYQLKTRVNSYTGYVQIGVRKDGKAKTFNVHRLVALAFIQNPTNLPEVNHRDEDKTNNQVSNLEWCDREYNTNYGTRNERVRKSKPLVKEQVAKSIGTMVASGMKKLKEKICSPKKVENQLGV